MGFWTDDINSDRVLSPTEIMREAGDELAARTGLLRVDVETVAVEGRVVHSFVVINPRVGRTWTLFEASHQPDECYPVLINPPVNDMPEYLKKRRLVPGRTGLGAALSAASQSAVFSALLEGIPGRVEENKWVCATPGEFRTKLTQLFAEDYVKVRVISMVAAGDSAPPDSRATEPRGSSYEQPECSDNNGTHAATSTEAVAESAAP